MAKVRPTRRRFAPRIRSRTRILRLRKGGERAFSVIASRNTFLALARAEPAGGVVSCRRTLYFDESGYNLLDPAQPIFAIASADIDRNLVDEVLRASFPRYRGAEFKFSSTWASNHRAELLTFARHLRRFEDLSLIYIVDKHFAVLTKIGDLLIELQSPTLVMTSAMRGFVGSRLTASVSDSRLQSATELNHSR